MAGWVLLFSSSHGIGSPFSLSFQLGIIKQLLTIRLLAQSIRLIMLLIAGVINRILTSIPCPIITCSMDAKVLLGMLEVTKWLSVQLSNNTGNCYLSFTIWTNVQFVRLFAMVVKLSRPRTCRERGTFLPVFCRAFTVRWCVSADHRV